MSTVFAVWHVCLVVCATRCFFFFFQAEDGIRDLTVTGVQTCALPISVERTAANRIQIVTTDPRTAWVVELTPDILAISCTSIDATLTAAVPAPAGRMPGRLMDTAGTPGSWAGTEGVGRTYGGGGGGEDNDVIPRPSQN